MDAPESHFGSLKATPTMLTMITGAIIPRKREVGATQRLKRLYHRRTARPCFASIRALGESVLEEPTGIPRPVLGLTFFVERERYGMGQGIDIKANDVGELGGKTRVARIRCGCN